MRNLRLTDALKCWFPSLLAAVCDKLVGYDASVGGSRANLVQLTEENVSN